MKQKPRNHPTVYADIMKASLQERAWAQTAKSEADDEAKRAVMWQTRGYPIFAKELKWDSKVANYFYSLRLNRAQMYKRLAQQEKTR